MGYVSNIFLLFFVSECTSIMCDGVCIEYFNLFIVISECTSLMCDGVCIEEEAICDGKVDCSDMSDEIQCGNPGNDH